MKDEEVETRCRSLGVMWVVVVAESSACLGKRRVVRVAVSPRC